MLLWLRAFFSEDAAVELVRRRILRGVYRDYQKALQVTTKA